MEIGEYVRTKRGYIARIVYMGEFIELDRVINFRRTSGHFYSGQIIFDDEEELEIVKHSKNIIDLIEVGDIVKVYVFADISDDDSEAVETYYRIESKYEIPELKESVKMNHIKILSILTREQYENNCYKLKE